MALLKTTQLFAILSVFYLTAAIEDLQHFSSWPAAHGEFPFVVSISCQSKQSGKTIQCSGSIIDHQHVLTSASCASQCGSYSIRIGSVNFYTGGKIVVSKSAFIHPYYDAETNKYDVAVIRTNPNAFSTENMIQVIAPSTVYSFKKDVTIFSSGWGKLGGKQSPILQMVDGQIYEPSTVYSPFVRTNFGGSSAERSYDTGSPLFAKSRGQWIQIGVATDFVKNSNQFGLYVSLFNKNVHNFINRIVRV